MVMCALGHILQATVDELLNDIKGIKIYIDDIFILIKEILSKNIEQIRIIFGELHAAGPKIICS